MKWRATLALIVAGVKLVWAQDCVPVPTPRSLLIPGSTVFVGTAMGTSSSGTRFRVTEAFKGVKSTEVDVVALRANYEVGLQYVVFAGPCPDGSKCLWADTCLGNHLLKYSQAIVEQLRAEKNGRPVASVYGMVTLSSGINMDESYYRSLPSVIVHARAGKSSYQAKTDQFGAYSFQTLPAGIYTVSADLPPNLEQDHSFDYPTQSFELPPRSSWEQNVYASPKGRISGKVIGPDGKQLRGASVGLFRAGQYQEGKSGRYAYQGERRPGEPWIPFEYEHLPAGDYIVVFNSLQQDNPDAPFGRTIRSIHLAEGQQILDADIQVSNPRPTRQITVRTEWLDPRPEGHYPPSVIVENSEGVPPHPFVAGPDTFTLNLFLNSVYTIHAEAACFWKGLFTTKTVKVDGGDPSVSDVSLVFEQGDCSGK